MSMGATVHLAQPTVKHAPRPRARQGRHRRARRYRGRTAPVDGERQDHVRVGAPVILTSGIVPTREQRSRFLAKPAELEDVLAAVAAALPRG